MERIDALRAKHTFIKEVRGKGLMIAIEFHEPNEFKLKMAWKLLHKVDKVLFAQMVVTQMLRKHRILTQVAGHAMDVIKILPPLIIGEKEVAYVCHRAGQRANRVPQIPRPDVGDRQQFRPRRDQLAQVFAGPGCFGVSRCTYGPAIAVTVYFYIQRGSQTQFHLIPIAGRFITELLFTGHLATVGDCTSPVFRCSEITSSLRARAMRMPAEIQPSPGRFK